MNKYLKQVLAGVAGLGILSGIYVMTPKTKHPEETQIVKKVQKAPVKKTGARRVHQ